MIERKEYLSRIDKLSSRMRQAGIDAVILTAESNIDYFSGYRHHAPWTLCARPFFQIISADGRSALLTHTFLEPEMRRTSAIDDIRTFAASGDAPVGQVREIMADLGVVKGKVGMELGYEQRLGIPFNDFRRLETELKAMEIVDASMMLWALRMFKSPAEIEIMRKSAVVTAAAFAAAFETAKPGMTEAQVCQVCAETMIEEGAERPGFILVTSGSENYHVLSGKPTARKLDRDEMIWIDMGALVDGYWSDFCRAAYFGKPTPQLEDGQKMILEINDAMIAATKPGEPLRKVAEAAVVTAWV
jgi:Xaa-Pro aminopeptidase